MSLFILKYRMSGGRVCRVPFYAESFPDAARAFNKYMGNCGAELTQYQLTGYREIPAPQVKLGSEIHRYYLDRLSADERNQFFQDRKTRNKELSYAC